MTDKERIEAINAAFSGDAMSDTLQVMNMSSLPEKRSCGKKTVMPYELSLFHCVKVNSNNNLLPFGQQENQKSKLLCSLLL